MVLESTLIFPYTDCARTDVLSALQVWSQRPRGMSLIRADLESVVSQPTVEWDA